MNTATAASPTSAPADVSDLVDILYEILASGLEPENATVSCSDIESFLHQHARSPKSRAEVEAFFAGGGLPQHFDGFARASGLRLAAVAPVTQSAGGDLNAPDVSTGRHVLERTAAAPAVAPTAVEVAPMGVVSQASLDRPGTQRLWFAFGVLSLALLGIGVFGGLTLMGLRDQVARTEANQQQLLHALAGLKSGTQQVDTRLDDQAKVLDAARHDLDRLAQSFLPTDGE
jgi:hypothetical protein